MSRTIRKDRNGLKYPEGQTRNVAYRCNCEWCKGKPKRIARAHLQIMKEELLEYNSIG